VAAEELASGPAAAADTYAHGHGAKVGENAPASVTTLDDDPEQRAMGWQAIENHEYTRGIVRKERRQSGDDRINIKIMRAPALVRAVADDPSCPANLRELIMEEETRLRSQAQLNGRRETVGLPLVSADASDVFAWIKRTDAWRTATREERSALSLSRGRAPRPVVVADLELPAELSDIGCLNVMRRLHAALEDPRGAAEQSGLADMKVPVTVALHHPDRLNDDRNRHLHLVAAKRRFRVDGGGVLARDSNGDLVAADRMEDFYWTVGLQKRLRETAARVINAELERERLATRMHAGRDEELGSSGPTMSHLSAAATVLGRAGVPTLAKLDNSIIAWSRQFDAVHERGRRERSEARGEAELARAQILDDQTKRVDVLRAYRARLSAIAAARAADELELLNDMARSGTEEVARYAPAYAAAAREKGRQPFEVGGWEARARLAQAELARLDLELNEEREAIRERRAAARAANLFADAIFVQADREIDYGDSELEPLAVAAQGEAEQLPSPDRSLPPQRLVDVIARAPVKLTRTDSGIVIRPEDDPEGSFTTTDLSRVQPRLLKLEEAQRKELNQIAAYLAKHGEVPEDVSSIQSDWLRAAIVKWRSTPVFARLAEQAAAEHVRPSGPPRAIGQDRVQAAAAPLQGPAVSQGSAVAWSENERALLEEIRLQSRHERHRIDAARMRALRDRGGDESTITPLAAQLLKRIADGFDPATVDPRPGLLGRTRDQEDATEIRILSQEPLFAARVADARRRDPKLLAQVDEVLRRNSASVPGLATVDRRGIIDFAARDSNGSAQSGRPHDFALQDLGRHKTRLPILSRDPVSGLIGIYDANLHLLLRQNHVALAHPDVQEQLEVAFRLQQAAASIFFERIRAGEVALSFKIEARRHDRVSEVGVIKGSKEDTRHVAQRARDPEFYIECRRVAAERVDAARGQLRHVAYRAWLAAAADALASPTVTRQLAALAVADNVSLPEAAIRQVEHFLESFNLSEVGRPDAKGRQRKPRSDARETWLHRDD
jgi:hypothetical protein